MKFTITREFFEVYAIEAETVEKAIAIMDECNIDPVEIVYGDITDIKQEETKIG
jgi:hypothetical protein